MKDNVALPKQQLIQQAAWQAFATYGYRKTSMDDIARGAGMSRPALYLHYKNKEDILRSLVQSYYDTAVDEVSRALAGPGTASRVLSAAFAAQIGDMIEALLSSPHGMELLDTSAATASDIKLAGEARLRELYADWLRRLSASGAVHLPGSPEQVAGTITAALAGIKTAGTDFATMKSRLTVLPALIGSGLDSADRS